MILNILSIDLEFITLYYEGLFLSKSERANGRKQTNIGIEEIQLLQIYFRIMHF